MAKDPAFLFYPGDWLGGTMHLDFECKGAYMELLMMQFQRGHMTLDMIHHVLGHKFDHVWPTVQDKFKTDGNVFWNERLRIEKEKRIRYTDSRKKNKEGKNQHTKNVGHMTSHMENENVIENKDFKYQYESVEKVDIEEKLLALDEIYLDAQRVKWAHINFDFEVNSFREKVRGSPDHYAKHDTGGIRLAFQSQLRNAKSKSNGISKKSAEIIDRREAFAKRRGTGTDGT